MRRLDASEDEQLERLRFWWDQYGRWVLGIGGLSLAIYLGIAGWSGYQHRQHQKAAAVYNQLIRDPAHHAEAATQLQTTYPRTIYAAFATLIQAKQAVDQQAWETALTHLQWVADRFSDPFLQYVAISRQARIYIHQQQWDPALALLKPRVGTGPYQADLAEILGDLYVQKGDLQAAREAYSIARSAATSDPDSRILRDMKWERLGWSHNTQPEPAKTGTASKNGP